MSLSQSNRADLICIENRLRKLAGICESNLEPFFDRRNLRKTVRTKSEMRHEQLAESDQRPDGPLWR